MTKQRSIITILVIIILGLTSCSPQETSENTNPENPNVILATTTSTQDSGLLDVLVPMFESQTGYTVQTIAVGTGAALKMAEEFKNVFLVFEAHHMLGDCSLIEGEYHESERQYGLGLETTLEYDDTTYTCTEMLGVAMSVAGQGRFAKALRLNAAATKMAKSVGCWIPEEIPLVFWHELVIKLIVGTREKLGEELTNQYEEEGLVMSFEEAVKYALNFKID